VVPGFDNGCNRVLFAVVAILSERNALEAGDGESAVRKGAVCRRQEAPARTSGSLTIW
jgi:hypothetical protein